MEEAGSDNPLAISITSGNRTIFPEYQAPDDAMRLIERFVGHAVVRVAIDLQRVLPRNASTPIAIRYHVATNTGESSVQFAA